MSTFSIFEIGKSALLASKRTMDVTSHNVANAATPGFSRQNVLLEPLIQRQARISGVGVRAGQILRSRDAFIDAVLRSETARKESFSAEKNAMDNIQVMAAEPSDNGLGFAIEGFWSAWQEVSIDPASVSARTSLMERGRSMVDMFRHMNGQIDSLVVDSEVNIQANIDQVNTLAQGVASLNVEIARAVARQETVADLLDRRDLLIDEITEMSGATVSRLDDRTQAVKVSISGFPVVDGNNAYKLAVHYPNGKTEYQWIDSAGRSYPLDAVGGRLGGLKSARDVIAGSFRNDLETIFRSIADSVNTQHAAGYSMAGLHTGSFFAVSDPANYLDSVQVAPTIVADTSTIAASASATDNLNGGNALSIADLLESNPLSQWAAIIGKLGIAGQRVKSGFETQELLVKELQNRKDSVSGVSLDEEMANLVREQHAFNAASRLITTADELLDTIINRLGAGR